MRESYGEGLARRTGPESCVDSRKAEHEALTGVPAGGVLSREILRNQSADAVSTGGRQHREIQREPASCRALQRQVSAVRAVCSNPARPYRDCGRGEQVTAPPIPINVT
jgi:hypothetical protein